MPVPVGFAQCEIVFTRTGDPQDMVITFGVEVTDPTFHDSVASHVALAWTTGFSNADISDQLYQKSAVVHIGEEGGEETTQEATINRTGGDHRPIVPQNTAMLARKITAVGGRQNQGRWFLPWVFEAEVDNVGMLDAGSASKYTTDCNAFLTALNSAAGTAATPMVIIHKRNKAGIVHAPTPVTAITCEQLVATQRRRLRR